MSDCGERTPVLLCSQCCECIKIVSEAVTCNGICGQMFHPQCIQLPRIFLNALKQPKRNLFWVCDSCLSQDAKGANYGVTILLERLYGILMLQSEQINIIRKEISSLKCNRHIGEICNQKQNKHEVDSIDTSEKRSPIDSSTPPTESQEGKSAVIESTPNTIQASPAPRTDKSELRGQFINNIMQLRSKKMNFFTKINDSSIESIDLNEKLGELREVKRDTIPFTHSPQVAVTEKIQFIGPKLPLINYLTHRTELDKLPAIVPKSSESKGKLCIRRKPKLRPIRRRPQNNLKEEEVKSKDELVLKAEKENFRLETNLFAKLAMPRKCSILNKKAVVSKCKRATAAEPETQLSKRDSEVTLLVDKNDSMSKKKSRKDARMKQVQKKREQLAKKAQKLDTLELESKGIKTKREQMKTQSRKRPLPTNENGPQIRTQKTVSLGREVRSVTEAVEILDNNEKQEDKLPERRMRAAYMSYVDKTLPILKKENPTLKLSQLKQVLQKEWYHSPVNPLNKR